MRRRIIVLCFLSLLIALSPVMSLAAAAAYAKSDLGDTDELIEYIESELRRYDESELYYEKYGISITLRDYINDSGVDTSLPEISALVGINDSHIAELFSKEDEYDRLLLDNAEKFIAGCESLLVLDDYLSMKAAYDEIYFCFFNMDVSSSEVQDAIKIYEAKAEELQIMEEKALIFIAAVENLCRAGEGIDKLPLILNAYSRGKTVDKGISGVSEAFEKLADEMEEYDNYIAPFNSELSSCREAVAYSCNHKRMSRFVTLILSSVAGEED